MKLEYKTDLLLLISLAILAVAIVLSLGGTVANIQFYETYIPLDSLSLAFFIIGPLTFLIFLTRAVKRRFITLGANAGLVIALLFMAFITFQLTKVERAYLNTIITPGVEAISGKGVLLDSLNNALRWTWLMFGLWVIGALTLIIWILRSLNKTKAIHEV